MEDVWNIILSMSAKPSAGFDYIPCKLLKLTELINDSFTKGLFRPLKKNTIVRLEFEKGEKHDISNYRDVSVLPVFSKIF